MPETESSARWIERSLRRRLRSFVDSTVGVVPLLAALVLASLGLPSLSRAQVAVPFSTNVQLLNTAQVASFVVDLGTLPLRPELIVDATPDGAHANMQLQIEITDFQYAHPDTNGAGGLEFCPEATEFIRSISEPGTARLTWPAWTCEPEPGTLAGDTARVNVRVLAFGSGGAPANVAIVIRGATSPPTSTQVVPYRVPGQSYSATFFPTKDTTIYERDPSGSNGTGQFLWAGRDVNTSSPFTPYRVRSLVAFNLRSGLVPSNATLTNAQLRLDVESIVGSGNSLSVYNLELGPFWAEGDADAAGSEFQAGTSVNYAATWLDRISPATPFSDETWFTPGGDTFDLLASQAISTTGVNTLSSAALLEFVEQLHQDGSTSGYRPDGFLLRGPENSAASSGLQIASSEATAVGANRPELVVSFTQPSGPQDGADQTGVVTFINEGQNLRWIYDLDHDDVYVTPVGGVCTVTSPITGSGTMSYTYSFGGAPGYSGLDCCTWHLDSDSGTLGTGQLIFFHNLDAGNPANMPPDTDLDGIRDLCDNCPAKANGPLLGSCLSGPSAGAFCRSNQECTSGICSLSQEDANSDKTGDACVPEPGSAVMLAAGVLALAGVRGRVSRARAVSPPRAALRSQRAGADRS